MVVMGFVGQDVHNNNYRSGVSSILFLEESFASFGYGIAFERFCPFFETFNRDIDRMISAGVMDYIQKKTNLYVTKNFQYEIGPQILTMEHLGIGFLFCLIPLLISVIVFGMEVFVKKVCVVR